MRKMSFHKNMIIKEIYHQLFHKYLIPTKNYTIPLIVYS